MDKFDLLLHAVDRPEDFTTEELLALLSDPELKEAYDILVDTRSALYPHSSIDVDKEWSDFSRRKDPDRSLVSSFFTRHSAAAIIAGFLTLCATAAVISVSLSRSEAHIIHSELTDAHSFTEFNTIPASAVTESDSLMLSKSDIMTFENNTLNDILTEIGTYYNVKINFTSDNSKKLRLFFKWDRSLSAEEVVRLLNNFDRISISFSENVITVK